MADVINQLREALADCYVIERELGRGGMATVYLARDLKHDRPVALKVLHPELAAAVGNERFLREIRIAAGFAHPHILPLHDSGQANGLLYYVMPFVSGESLRARLRLEHHLAPEEAIRITRDVADALSYAHQQGIVHRDVKPENVLFEAGHAVLSDFGVARAISLAGDQLTETGVAIGSPSYMSPEQVLSERDIDGRADVYALGCLLYEMVAGRPPFQGDTAQVVLRQHLAAVPRQLSSVQPGVPPHVSQAVAKALAKTPEDRWATAAEFAAALGGAGRGGSFVGRFHAVRGLQRVVLETAVTLTVVAMGGWLLLRDRAGSADTRPGHIRLTFSGQARDPAISPDGKLFAYGSDSAVLVQDLRGGQPLVVHHGRGMPLAWSPDGSELLVGVEDDRNAAILAIPAFGGVPRRLWHDSIPSHIPPAAIWAPDGSHIAVACRFKVCLISKRTGESVAIAADSTKLWMLDLDWSAKANLIVFIATNGLKSAMWTIAPDGSSRAKMLEDSVPLYSPRWSADGAAIYYLRGGEEWREVWKLPVSHRTGRARGAASLVASGLQPGTRFTLSVDRRRLLYTREVSHANLWLVTLHPGASGHAPQAKQLTTGTLSKWGPSLSPDGGQIAFTMGDARKANIYTMSVDGDSLRQITFFDAFSSGPVWSPDGRQIAFGSMQGGEPDVWIADADGGNVRRFPRSELVHNFVGAGEFQLAWSPDSAILYQHTSGQRLRRLDPRTGSERWLLQDSGGRTQGSPRLSPTGKLLALRWSRPHHGLWVVSLITGSQQLIQDYHDWFDPLGWSSDERWIYVFEHSVGSPRLTRVPAGGGPVEELTALPFLLKPGLWGSMSPDASRFVFEKWEEQSDVWMVEHFD